MTTLLAIDIIGGWRTPPLLGPKKPNRGRDAMFRRRDSRRCHGEIPCSAVSPVPVRALRPPYLGTAAELAAQLAQDEGPGGRYTPGPSSFLCVQGRPISPPIPVIPILGIRWIRRKEEPYLNGHRGTRRTFVRHQSATSTRSSGRFQTMPVMSRGIPRNPSGQGSRTKSPRFSWRNWCLQKSGLPGHFRLRLAVAVAVLAADRERGKRTDARGRHERERRTSSRSARALPGRTR